MIKLSAWECSDCGRVEYGNYPPEECQKCWKTNSFVGLSEDVAEQMKDNILDQIKTNEENENGEDDLTEALK